MQDKKLRYRDNIIGRDDIIDAVVAELKKGKHVLITGGVGMGKSAIMHEGLKRLNTPGVRIIVREHQAKGQITEIVRQMLENDLITTEALELPEKYHGIKSSEIEWNSIKRIIARLNIRDMSAAIIPALSKAKIKPIIIIDDLTFITPTQQAFWLAILNYTQVIGCAAELKNRLKKLWWKMKEIKLKPLSKEASRQVVQTFITETGMLVESPQHYIAHVVKQSGGVPLAIYDMIDDSSKERVICKRKVRAMAHDAGVSYVDFTPFMLIIGAMIVSMRYIGMGTGDKTLYIIGGIAAALFLTLRFFMFRGSAS